MESTLDEHTEQIMQWLNEGVTVTRVAQNLKINRATLYHFLKTRQLIPVTNHPLEENARQIVSDVTSHVGTEIYLSCAKAIEGIEHEGIWLGNGHHAAQKIQAAVLPTLKYLLAKEIRKQVLR